MPRQARGEVLDPSEVQVTHCIQRCVRRAFLCGDDPLTGNSYEHRRGWIRDRLEFLASEFSIDCLTFSVMHNHIHLVLRNRPDVVAAWSDEEVARRWLRLFPRRQNEDGSPADPSEPDTNGWCDVVRKYGRIFKRVADTPESLAGEACRRGQGWLCAWDNPLGLSSV